METGIYHMTLKRCDIFARYNLIVAPRRSIVGLILNSGLGLDDLLASTTTPRLQSRCFAIHFLLNKVALLWCFTLGSLAIHNDGFSKERKRRWGGWWWQRRNRQVYVYLRMSDVSCPVANVARNQEKSVYTTEATIITMCIISTINMQF